MKLNSKNVHLLNPGDFLLCISEKEPYIKKGHIYTFAGLLDDSRLYISDYCGAPAGGRGALYMEHFEPFGPIDPQKLREISAQYEANVLSKENVDLKVHAFLRRATIAALESGTKTYSEPIRSHKTQHKNPQLDEQLVLKMREELSSRGFSNVVQDGEEYATTVTIKW